MAVLPTPGSPMSTGLFLVRRRQDLDDAADLLVAADDRVELALAGVAVRSRPYVSSAWYVLSGFWSVTRWPPRTSLERLQDLLVAGAGRLEDALGVAAGLGGGQEQVLGRDVLVASAG